MSLTTDRMFRRSTLDMLHNTSTHRKYTANPGRFVQQQGCKIITPTRLAI